MEQTDPKTLASGTGTDAPRTTGPREIPARLGRYEVRRRIGHGAMGVVLEAFDPLLERTVAIKVLSLDPSPRRRAAMLREAQALARLADPSVVAVHDVGEVNGRIFLAMDLVEGRSLRQVLGDAPQEAWPQRLRWLLAAGRGLASAHEAGVVHGDFKPANIMIADSGEVRVVDFGLARLADGVDDSVPLLARGAVARSLSRQVDAEAPTIAGVGTPAYLAAEQWGGAPADARSDQFAFCVTTWETLYGARPFAADSVAETTARVLEGRWNRPPRSPVPPRIRRALVRGLAADPARRWPSMRALVAALSPRSRWVPWLVPAALAGSVVCVAWLRPDRPVGRPLHELVTSFRACDRLGPSSLEWGSDTRADIEEAFAATGLPYARGTVERLPRHVERWLHDEELARRRLCLAAALPGPGEVSPPRVQRCIEALSRQMAELFDTWRSPSPRDVEVAIATAMAIDEPTRCLQPHYLRQREQLESLPDPARERVEGLLAATTLGLGDDAPDPARSLPQSPDGVEDLYLEAAQRGLDESAAALAVIWLRRNLLTQADAEVLAQSEAHARAAVARLPEESVVQIYFELTLAEAEAARGEVAQSAARYVAVVDRATALWGPDHPQTGRIWLNTAGAQRAAGDVDAARRSHRRGVEVLERTLGPDHPHAVVARLAEVLAQDPSPQVEREAYEQALDPLIRSYGRDAIVVAKTQDNLAAVLDDLDPAAAEQMHLAALATWRAGGDVYAAYAARSLSNLGVLHAKQRRWQEAIAAQRQARSELEEKLGADHRDTQLVQQRLDDAVAAAAGGTP